MPRFQPVSAILALVFLLPAAACLSRDARADLFGFGSTHCPLNGEITFEVAARDDGSLYTHGFAIGKSPHCVLYSGFSLEQQGDELAVIAWELNRTPVRIGEIANPPKFDRGGAFQKLKVTLEPGIRLVTAKSKRHPFDTHGDGIAIRDRKLIVFENKTNGTKITLQYELEL